MRPSDAESELDIWIEGGLRVYTYVDFSFITELIVFEKHNKGEEFLCHGPLSTKDIGNQDRESMLKLLTSNRLKFKEIALLFIDYHKIKTGGCECGGWATSNPTCHSFICPLYKSNR